MKHVLNLMALICSSMLQVVSNACYVVVNVAATRVYAAEMFVGFHEVVHILKTHYILCSLFSIPSLDINDVSIGIAHCRPFYSQ